MIMAIGIKLTDDADGYNWPSNYENLRPDKILDEHVAKLAKSMRETMARRIAQVYNIEGGNENSQ